MPNTNRYTDRAPSYRIDYDPLARTVLELSTLARNGAPSAPKHTCLLFMSRITVQAATSSRPTVAPRPTVGTEADAPPSIAATLRTQVLAATLYQTGSFEAVVYYSIEVTCRMSSWNVERRSSEFVRIHNDFGHDLGHDTPSAGIFAFTHVHGPVLARNVVIITE